MMVMHARSSSLNLATIKLRALAEAMATALLILLLFSLLLPSSIAQFVSNDTKEALLIVKLAFHNPSSLSSWSESSSPCNPNSIPWDRVLCKGATVIGLHLESLSLSGFVDTDALFRLNSLSSLSLSNNTLSGPIPPLNKIRGLKTLSLSRNNFHGPIPREFFADMTHLEKLHLSHNHFSGPLPFSLSELTMLTELYCQGNNFSGDIWPLNDLPLLHLLDLSNNNLSGLIPHDLGSKFRERSFLNNSGLCGPPLTGKPCGPDLLVVIVMIFVVMVVALTSIICDDLAIGKLGVHNGKVAVAKAVLTKRGNGWGELVMVNNIGNGKGIEKGDLMKAAAKVMGRGGIGIVYKAVLGNGTTVAVKKMRTMGSLGKETFDVEMRRFGRLRHKNVLPPLAYFHNGKEEKVLVFEYVPKGSLLYTLHGGQGTDRTALDWSTRLRIILGVVQGMVYLHAELNSLDVPHGNLKSANVLLTSRFDPLLTDYGYIPFLNPSVASQVMFAYQSPEALGLRKYPRNLTYIALGSSFLKSSLESSQPNTLMTSMGELTSWLGQMPQFKRIGCPK